MERVILFIKRTPTVALIIAAVFFIAGLSVIGIYSDRQIVDYRTDQTSNEPLGINQVSFIHALLRYDSNHYRNIVNHGYDSTNAAFFPLYPALVYVIHTTLGLSVDYALFAVSWFFCIAAALVMFYWLKYELTRLKSKLSPWAVMFLISIFPTSFYFMLGYTESLFVFLTIGAIFAYRRKLYWIAGLLTALATATRVQGGVLAILFLADYLISKDWKDWKKLIPVIMSTIGIGIYMIFLWQQFGNPFEFILAQRQWGRLNGNIATNLVDSMTPPYLWYLPVLGLMLYAVYKKLGNIWFWYCLLFIAIPISSGRIDSLNRYMLALPPLFLGFSLWLESKSQNIKLIYIASSAFLLAWNIVFFFNGYWVA